MRSRAYQKRGGAVANITLDAAENALIAPERGPELLALDSALERLGDLNGQEAKIVNCDTSAGLRRKR